MVFLLIKFLQMIHAYIESLPVHVYTLAHIIEYTCIFDFPVLRTCTGMCVYLFTCYCISQGLETAV